MSALRLESGELAYCGESALPWAFQGADRENDRKYLRPEVFTPGDNRPGGRATGSVSTVISRSLVSGDLVNFAGLQFTVSDSAQAIRICIAMSSTHSVLLPN
jgi:hypothetical protein